MTLLPEAFIQSPLFGIALTVVVYVLCELIVDKFELNIVPPFVLACPMIILFIYLQEPYITYDDYENGAGFINFLLGPATVALALYCCHCYRHRQHFCLRQNFRRQRPGAAFHDT